MATKTKSSGSYTRWIPTLYFAEGLPFVAITIVASVIYKGLGIPDKIIAFWTTVILLPYTLKPLWSPVLEMFKTKKYFVVATQFFTGILFGLIALTLPLSHFFQYSIALLAIMAVSGATHDISADGVYINTLNFKEQAQYSGWLGAFYNLAKVMAQGAFVYIAGLLKERIGFVNAWMIVMGLFGAVMVLLSLWHTRVLPTGGSSKQVSSIKEGFQTLWDVLSDFFKKKYITWGIIFIILYRFAEGQAMKILPLFLLAGRESGGLGITEKEFGLIYGTFGVAAFVVGSLLAGYFVARRGLKKSILILCAFFNIPFAVYVFLSSALPTSLSIVSIAVVFEYFGYGFGFVGLTLFMMQQIAPGKYKMAHYAFATGLMNLGLMIPSMISGVISDWLGYKKFFIWVLFATIPSFLAAWLVPFKENNEESET